MSLLSRRPRSATVAARSPVLVYGLGREDFLALSNPVPAVREAPEAEVRPFLHRLRKANADVLKLSTALSIALSK
jgi:CRP-like cAMP-binding protein